MTANRPSRTSAAISLIATLPTSGTATTVDGCPLVLVPAVHFWESLLTVVPLSWDVLADTRDLPLGKSQAGDRHLNFHDVQGNLRLPAKTWLTLTAWARPHWSSEWMGEGARPG